MTQVTYAQAFREGVREEMVRDSRIFIMGTDLYDRGGHFAQVLGLGAEFGPERIRDAPISEAAMVAAGIGAAINGMRPVVDLNFVDFALGAMDEIANRAAKMRYMTRVPLPLVIRATAGVAGYAMQHNNSLEAWFAHMPGLLVATPATPYDVKGLIKTSLRAEDPIVFLTHKRLGGSKGDVGGPDVLVPFGHAEVVRAGDAATIVTFSMSRHRSMDAAAVLADEGVSVEVIDLRTIVPLDYETIYASVRKTGRVVVVDEAPRFAGMGGEIAAQIQESVFRWLDAPVVRLGAPHVPIPYSPKLYEPLVPGAEAIAAAVRMLIDS
jgi:pyruvate dehydrogenase E1 component beta subunit